MAATVTAMAAKAMTAERAATETTQQWKGQQQRRQCSKGVDGAREVAAATAGTEQGKWQQQLW